MPMWKLFSPNNKYYALKIFLKSENHLEAVSQCCVSCESSHGALPLGMFYLPSPSAFPVFIIVYTLPCVYTKVYTMSAVMVFAAITNYFFVSYLEQQTNIFKIDPYLNPGQSTADLGLDNTFLDMMATKSLPEPEGPFQVSSSYSASPNSTNTSAFLPLSLRLATMT